MSLCKIKSIQKIEPEARYDLEIEDNHNFYANGILVHNCRMVAKSDGLWSRQGKPIVSCPHISDGLKPLFDKFPDLVIDGELYNHSLADDFNEIMSLAKQLKPTQKDLEASAKMVQYHVYDCYDPDHNDYGFFERSFNLCEKLQDTVPRNNIIVVVPTTCANSQSKLDELYGQYLENGYEGQIVRIDGTPYENKRTKNLLKRKEFQDAEFEISNIIEGEGNRAGGAGAIVFKMDNGHTFKAGIKGDIAYFKTLLTNASDYIGCQAKVKFFNWTPPDDLGISRPRFATTIQIYQGKRDD